MSDRHYCGDHPIKNGYCLCVCKKSAWKRLAAKLTSIGILRDVPPPDSSTDWPEED